MLYVLQYFNYAVTLWAAEYKCMEIPWGNQRVSNSRFCLSDFISSINVLWFGVETGEWILVKG